MDQRELIGSFIVLAKAGIVGLTKTIAKEWVSQWPEDEEKRGGTRITCTDNITLSFDDNREVSVSVLTLLPLVGSILVLPVLRKPVLLSKSTVKRLLLVFLLVTSLVPVSTPSPTSPWVALATPTKLLAPS